jgi:hypothetical protein
MEQLMTQGHQGPPPASRVVMDGLPRITLDQAALGGSYLSAFFNMMTGRLIDASIHRGFTVQAVSRLPR